MKLTEKIEKAKTCIHFSTKHDGNCRVNGYAPFDCEYCSSFKVIPLIGKNTDSEPNSN